jgi:hypothetical protein
MEIMFKLFGVEWIVTGEFDPGTPAVTHLAPEDCDEGEPPEFVLLTIKTEDPGEDLLGLFNDATIAKFEEKAAEECLKQGVEYDGSDSEGGDED